MPSITFAPLNHLLMSGVLSLMGLPPLGAEGDNGFAAEIIAVGKGCYCHRRGVPPDGVTYKNNIILGHVFHFVFQRRACVISFFLLCKFRCFAVNGRIRGSGFDFENIGAGFALDKLCYFFGVAGMAEVGYEDFFAAVSCRCRRLCFGSGCRCGLFRCSAAGGYAPK